MGTAVRVSASPRRSVPPTATGVSSEIPDPRYPYLWASVVYALCTLSLAWPILTGQFLVNPHSDQLIAGFAFRDFAAQALRAGEGFPQWNPFLYGGMPYVAAMHGDIFYPTFLLRLIFPTDIAMSLGFAVHLFLAGLLTFAFLRAWRLSFFPALIGGVAYMLSGQLAGLASPGHDGKLFVSALLPLVLLALTRGIRDGRPWAWGMLALGVGLGLLSPHPQLLQYLLLTAGAFALFLAFARSDEAAALPRPVAIRRLGLALGGVVLGAMIGAIQFLPVRGYVAWSPRSGGRDYDYATSYSFPIEELINSYLPQFTGLLDNYWGRNGIHFHSEYIGAAVLFLAAAAIGVPALRSFRRFWLGALIIGVLWALGGHTPFYRIVYELVPGTKFFRAPSTIYFVYAFAIAVFAAFGTARLLARNLSTKYIVAGVGAAAAIALLMTVGADAFTRPIAESVAAGYPPQYAAQFTSRAAANSPEVIMGGWRSFLFVGLVGLAAWLVLSGRTDRRVAAWALVVIVAADLWSIQRLYWLFSPPASTIFAPDDATEALRTAPPGRVIAAGRASGPDAAFTGDGLMVHGVRNLMGYHGNELGRFQMLLGKTAQSNYDDAIMFSPSLWRHENVRYLYTTIPDSSIGQVQADLGLDSALVKIAGPTRNAAGTIVYLYRLPGDNPPAWLAQAVVKATDDQARSTVLDPRFEPRLAAIVPDTSAWPEFNESTGQTVPTPEAVSVTTFRPGAIDLTVTRPPAGRAALVVSENYFPGWSATGDGKELQVTRANYNLIGVLVPAGTREIQLRFQDPAYQTGKTLTLLALLLSITWLAVGAFLARRQPTPAPSGA